MKTKTSIGFPEPPAVFFFRMIIDGISDSDQSFQEVSGIGPELDVEEVIEDGENRFVHRVPKAVKHSRLVLKRGIASVNSPLTGWCRSVLEAAISTPIVPKEIKLYLLDENEKALRGWSFADAYPVKWELAGWEATNNKVEIDSIELNYSASKSLD